MKIGIVGAACCLILFGLALAQDTASEEGAAESGLTCSVSGYDIVIFNGSDTVVPAGSVITWSVPFARSEGEHILDKDLDAEGRIFLSGVLGSSFLVGDQACEVGAD